jgi:hypothetical protein
LAAERMGAERRRTIRYPFDATAEVSEEATKGTLAVRITELSLNGCYVSTASPFPTGTQLFLKVFSEGSFFEAHANVVYTHPNKGMGIAFRELKPYFVGVLKKWLLAAMLGKNKPQD